MTELPGHGILIRALFRTCLCRLRGGSIGRGLAWLNPSHLSLRALLATRILRRKSTNPINLEQRASLEQWEEVYSEMVTDSASRTIWLIK